MQYDAGEITTNGVSVPIKVDDEGNWRAEYGGQYLCTDTRDKLKGRLARLTRGAKVELEIPVIKVDVRGPSDRIVVTRGVLTGLHGANGNVLVTWTRRGKEVKEQISGGYGGYGDLYLAGDVTNEELKEYAEILRLKKETQDREEKWRRAREIKPKDAVQRAIDARVSSETED